MNLTDILALIAFILVLGVAYLVFWPRPVHRVVLTPPAEREAIDARMADLQVRVDEALADADVDWADRTAEEILDSIEQKLDLAIEILRTRTA